MDTLITILTYAGPAIGAWILWGKYVVDWVKTQNISPKIAIKTKEDDNMCALEKAASLAREFKKGSEEREFIQNNIAPQIFEKIVNKNGN